MHQATKMSLHYVNEKGQIENTYVSNVNKNNLVKTTYLPRTIIVTLTLKGIASVKRIFPLVGRGLCGTVKSKMEVHF